MYKKVSPNMNFADREKRVGEFWKKNDIFKKSITNRENCPEYMFYDGPPTANGRPHIGHVLTRVIKDMIPRYRTMRGFKVPRKAGWDTHGLPVELEVEKALGLDGKEQIEAYGIGPFIEKCKESVWKYEGMWREFSEKVGFWADMDNPYVTYHNSYIESVWWSLKKIWEKGLLYKGFKIVPYCPRCGTPLSSHEVAQGYREVKEKSLIVAFRAKDAENTYFLAWTTTPWTLPSNVALCVNPDETYVTVENSGRNYILAKALLEDVMEGDYKIISSCKGSDLEYRQYEPLFDFADSIIGDKKAYFVTCGTHVTMSDGTGIVHTAPAFGEDDNRIGREYGLPFVQLVNAAGRMTDDVTPWAGMWVKDADKQIIKDLKNRGLLYKVLELEHAYPHCWRCGTPLLYYARDSWFIAMTNVKEGLIANNATINWIPENIGKGRFGDWLNNVQDWGVSRNRYWGTPLNIWQCDCGHMHSIGSIAELREMSDDCPEEIELHRPFIDAVTIKCPKCGKKMHRVPEVIDCWYDSGAMPFAQYHYPFENAKTFKDNFPAAFISEAVDQTRGWFYSLLAISTLIFGRAPYENVIVLGHVQDENGRKMSKSKGNAIDPMDALEQYGADAVRWYFYINSAPWLPNRWKGELVSDFSGKFLGTLWNTYAFYILYAEIDGFDPTKHTLDAGTLTVMDRWLLSRLNSLIGEVADDLDNYMIPEAARALQAFLDDMSNWYVRRCRARFWAKGMEADKISAYMTLYTALTSFCKLAAPMTPFITEDIYQNIVRSVDPSAPESIHLCDFPNVCSELIDRDLEQKMDVVLKIVALGRACRNVALVKNRQPLAMMYAKSPCEPDSFYTDIIRDELNVKNIEFKDDISGYVSYSFKPQLRTLGPRFGRRIGDIKALLSGINSTAAMDELGRTGHLTLKMPEGDTITLEKDDLLIEQAQNERYVAQSNGKTAVVIDTKLTPGLIEEGFVREIISKIQTMRKEAGFEVMDRIMVTAQGSGKIKEVLDANREQIMGEVLADSICYDSCRGYVKDWNINGEAATLGVERV